MTRTVIYVHLPEMPASTLNARLWAVAKLEEAAKVGRAAGKHELADAALDMIEALEASIYPCLLSD